MKKYRFFYHYNKCTKRLSIHFRGTCHSVDDILCYVTTESKHNKRQPFLVMQGHAAMVRIERDEKGHDWAIIDN
jgi:hypothetical protein